MSKNLHGSFPRLAIVNRHPKTQQQKPVATTQAPNTGRMTVMPKVPRRGALALLWAWWNGGCRFFMTGPVRPRGAALLSFRRPGMRAHLVRPAFAGGGFCGKKASGTVRWHGDHAIAPQEEGRG